MGRHPTLNQPPPIPLITAVARPPSHGQLVWRVPQEYAHLGYHNPTGPHRAASHLPELLCECFREAEAVSALWFCFLLQSYLYSSYPIASSALGNGPTSSLSRAHGVFLPWLGHNHTTKGARFLKILFCADSLAKQTLEADLPETHPDLEGRSKAQCFLPQALGFHNLIA